MKHRRNKCLYKFGADIKYKTSRVIQWPRSISSLPLITGFYGRNLTKHIGIYGQLVIISSGRKGKVFRVNGFVSRVRCLEKRAENSYALTGSLSCTRGHEGNEMENGTIKISSFVRARIMQHASRPQNRIIYHCQTNIILNY